MVGRNEWIRIQQVPTDASFDISGRVSLSDEDVRQKIMRSTYGKEPHEIGSWEKPDRGLMLRKLKEGGLSIRHIERATVISRGIVARS